MARRTERETEWFKRQILEDIYSENLKQQKDNFEVGETNIRVMLKWILRMGYVNKNLSYVGKAKN